MKVTQLLFCIRMYLKMRPDLIYVDHANNIMAAIFSRFTKTPVVYRVMGVYPAMRDVLKGYRPGHVILRFCYRSPFRKVITLDGSGIEPWLEKANKKTEIHSLINGVNLKECSHSIEEFSHIDREKTVVLYVGKLMKSAKGCEEFLEGFIKAYNKSDKNLHGVSIGFGSKRNKMVERVKKVNLEPAITFIERMPHESIMKAHDIADIYVSLNRLGNLSVANLEAMKSGQCMIFPESQRSNKIDEITDRLIPQDSVKRIKSTDDVDGLAKEILNLHKKPDQRKILSEKMFKCAQGFIPSWEKRVGQEYNILKDILNSRS